MNILLIVQNIVCILTFLTGLLVFINPSAVYGFTGLRVEGVRGISELRSIFGGLFMGLGIIPFYLGSTAVLLIGWAYLSIAVCRVFSIFFDKSFERSNIISVIIEIIFGIILIN